MLVYSLGVHYFKKLLLQTLQACLRYVTYFSSSYLNFLRTTFFTGKTHTMQKKKKGEKLFFYISIVCGEQWQWITLTWLKKLLACKESWSSMNYTNWREGKGTVIVKQQIQNKDRLHTDTINTNSLGQQNPKREKKKRATLDKANKLKITGMYTEAQST